MTEQNTRQGIILMIVTTLVFAVQDGISRHLVADYPVLMVVMIRYWFFAAFVRTDALRCLGRTGHPATATGIFLFRRRHGHVESKGITLGHDMDLSDSGRSV